MKLSTFKNYYIFTYWEQGNKLNKICLSVLIIISMKGHTKSYFDIANVLGMSLKNSKNVL